MLICEVKDMKTFVCGWLWPFFQLNALKIFEVKFFFFFLNCYRFFTQFLDIILKTSSFHSAKILIREFKVGCLLVFGRIKKNSSLQTLKYKLAICTIKFFKILLQILLVI